MMKRTLFIALLAIMASAGTAAAEQAETEAGTTADALVTNAFSDNWYLQMGADMNLLNPYRHDFSKVFPNGKSFGVDLALGKWFSPVFGVRGKVKWNNGILKNDHALWLRPYGERGGNHRHGGFVVFSGDMMLNVHNLLGEYRADRQWNTMLAVRGGGWVDLGSGKGAPMLGVGIINTLRVSRRWSLFADLGYHFISSVNDVASGRGSGSNGFAEVSVGAQLDLGRQHFDRAAAASSQQDAADGGRTVIGSFWSGWFAQAGMGMTLHNPCGTNFANVFPNGKTLGVNVAVGKWFTDQVGVRGGLNWQNGIVGNSHLAYIDPVGVPGGNHDDYGSVAVYADVFFNLHNIAGGYDDARRWNAILFPRLGIAKNFTSSFGETPLLGIGTEQTCRLNDRLKLVADVAYQVTTSGFLDDRYYTGHEGANSNGWLDINIGVEYALGRNGSRFSRR